MSEHRKVAVTFDAHDHEQIVLLARMNHIQTAELIRRIVRGYLDKAKPNLTQEQLPR